MRRPPIGKIRAVLDAMYEKRASTDEALLEIVKRFSDADRNYLADAVQTLSLIKLRRGKRMMLAAQRTQALTEFLEFNGYACLSEAADDLGFASAQEVWDLIMDDAGLPPSEVPAYLNDVIRLTDKRGAKVEPQTKGRSFSAAKISMAG